MICEKCGKEIVDNTEHCPHCGPGYEGRHGHHHRHLPTSGMAVASMVLGIVSSLCWILTAIPGLIVGIKGLKRINSGKFRGKRKAIAGIIMNTLFMFMPILLIIGGMTTQGIIMGLQESHRIKCASQLKQIGLAMKQYAVDNANYFPDKDNYDGFRQLIGNGYLRDKKISRCPACDSDNKNSYIYLGAGRKGSVELSLKNYPLAFDRPGNHWGYINVLFLDGHVETIKSDVKNSVELINMLSKTNKDTPSALNSLRKKAATPNK